MTDLELRRARPQEASALSALAIAAKGFWGYDQQFLDDCRPELTFTPDDMDRFVVAEQGGTIIACYSIDGTPPIGELGNMWITPSKIGTGLGRTLWHEAMTTAATAGFTLLDIGADPNAEGFYRKMGAERTGEIPSGSIPGRVLPLMRVQVPQQ